MFVAMMILMMKNCDYNEYQKNVGDNDDNNNNILHCILFSLNFFFQEFGFFNWPPMQLDSFLTS